LTCRFKNGNPFLPAKDLLAWTMLKTQANNHLTVQLRGVIEFRTGRLPAGHSVEVRVLRVDAPEWRFDQCHSWPAGISLFVEDRRVLLKKPDEDDQTPPGPLDISNCIVRAPGDLAGLPMKVSAAVTAKKSEQWALGLVLIEPMGKMDMVCRHIIKKVQAKQMPEEDRKRLDLERIFAWVTAHRPDRVSKKDTLRNVEPPVMKLTCCTSLMRISLATRGPMCDHLQCFDLESYIHTMRSIPPKHAWCCPICDRPAPLHRLRLDAFAQSVIDATEPNVTEVLVADTGAWEVSAVDEPMDDDSSEDDGPPIPRKPTMVDLQQAALNLGRAFSAPSSRLPAQAPQASPPPRRSRSPKRKDKDKGKKEESEVDKKRENWEKLQGIAKPEEPKEETRFGWLPENAHCSKCEKSVVDKGGVYCGRKRPNGEYVGCFEEICWKCMNKANKKEFGSVKTSKTEFSSLGPDAWWMHEKCMSAEDKKEYFGESDEEDGKKKDASDDEGGTFAWL